ncbi:cyclase family protein [Catellatospora bangladeshensis]|uniref:Cyclase n=1 Tax=Catellatospora bangladeshensis TaxID=310355 RepID=A0A8J3JL18_9ACTN|nr:cyclase family protein [Catellatospora bangladeshensis]GIF79089.1 cyclase [Catellatospora bangladeshensis]
MSQQTATARRARATAHKPAPASRFIDLSTPVDAAAWEPEPVLHEIMTPAQGAVHMAEEMKHHFGVDFDPAVLPDGELLSVDTLKLTTHTGTHIDAPSHYGSKASYGTPRHIDEMPLDWFHRPAVCLDLRSATGPTVDADFLAAELARIGYQLQPLDIVLLHTGASAWAGTPRYFTEFIGLDASATNFLLDKGVRVIGTDAFSLDAPFGAMLARFKETGDKGVLWPAHFTGRDREFCQIERLANLDALPQPYGFTVSCLPIKIKGAGAGWTRAVAIL